MLDRVSLEAAMAFCSIRRSSIVASVAMAATVTLIAGCSGGQRPAPGARCYLLPPKDSSFKMSSMTGAGSP
jgi:hypothetical protein